MFKIRKIVLQPAHGLQVQVVGRLVEQQVVRLSEESTSQQHTHLLLTAQVLHQGVMQIFGNAQATQQAGCIAFGIPPLHLGKLLFEFGHANTILIAEVGFRIQRILLAHHLPKCRMSHQDRIHHGIFVESEVVLTQDRQTFARA